METGLLMILSENLCRRRKNDKFVIHSLSFYCFKSSDLSLLSDVYRKPACFIPIITMIHWSNNKNNFWVLHVFYDESPYYLISQINIIRFLINDSLNKTFCKVEMICREIH